MKSNNAQRKQETVQRHIKYALKGKEYLAHIFVLPEVTPQTLAPEGAENITELSEQENAALEQEDRAAEAVAMIDAQIAALERKQDRPLREIGLGAYVQENKMRLADLDARIEALRTQRAALQQTAPGSSE